MICALGRRGMGLMMDSDRRGGGGQAVAWFWQCIGCDWRLVQLRRALGCAAAAVRRLRLLGGGGVKDLVKALVQGVQQLSGARPKAHKLRRHAQDAKHTRAGCAVARWPAPQNSQTAQARTRCRANTCRVSSSLVAPFF